MIIFTRSIIIAITLVLVMSNYVCSSTIEINEVLSNEPNSNSSLEWIELYNSTNATVNLFNFYIVSDNDTIRFSQNDSIEADSYLVLCRKLFSTTTAGFEEIWGNNSGSWGDAPEESYYRTPIERSFSLINSSGDVRLFDNSQTLISQFEWVTSGEDGKSWEKMFPDSQLVFQSGAFIGATPGILNSVALVDGDLAIENLQISSDNGFAIIELDIVSHSSSQVSFANLTLLNSDSQENLFFVSIPTIEAGSSYHYRSEFSFVSLYQSLEARLSFDSRLENNNIIFMAPGADYPPLELNEIMPAPTDALNSEWIEIKNNQTTAFDIANWKLKVGDNKLLITTEETLIEPNEYLVIVQDSLAFRDFYFDASINIIQPSGWEILKNGSDTIGLIDNFGIEASRHIYASTFDGNITLSKDEEFLNDSYNQWGRSEYIGGSPGEKNQTLIQPNSSDIEISLSTRIISPDNDGIEDFTAITVDAPISESYTLKIFDRHGRLIKNIFDQQEYIPTTINWNGKDDSGRLVPIGIYIIYFEATPNYKTKTTVVVAR